MEKLYQEVRLISPSSIITLWVLPANIDARHFPNALLNLDLGNSQQFVHLSAQFPEQHGAHRSSRRTYKADRIGTCADEHRDVPN